MRKRADRIARFKLAVQKNFQTELFFDEITKKSLTIIYYIFIIIKCSFRIRPDNIPRIIPFYGEKRMYEKTFAASVAAGGNNE